MARMGRFAPTSAMAVCLGAVGSAGAQDDPRPLTGWSTADELVAALDRDEPVGMAYVGGVLGAFMLRGAQGDPVLWWVQRCIAANFLTAESLVPGLRTWAAEHSDLSPPTALATNAILHVIAETCGRAYEDLMPAE